MGIMLLLFLFLAQAAVKGNASFGGVVLIGPIPIIFGSSPQMAIASALLAIVLMSFSFLLLAFRPKHILHEENDAPEQKAHDEQAKERATKIKGGAVVMIGPVPLVFGSDSKTAMLMMLIALAITSIWLLAALR